jgi:hypothetical protein
MKPPKPDTTTARVDREHTVMPEICRFLGISICMYFNDHDPPHFHVRYNEFRAVFRVADLSMSDGQLPPRITALVLEWANLFRADLLDAWERLRADGVAVRIPPLV